MTETYYPFDAGAGASVLESQWTAMARNWLPSGVLRGDLNGLEVYADDTGMQVKGKTGRAWVEGHFYQSDALQTLAIDTADPANPRIDRVVIQLDWTNNLIDMVVIKGTAAAVPAAPALTQTVAKWEISLAQVLVGTGVVSITADKVTDERSYTLNLDQLLLFWAEAEAYQMLAISYDGTYTDVIASATVVWPDGSAGVFTATTINSTWLAIDAYTITHTLSGLTVTQTAVTRDGTTGKVTAKPALTVA